MPFSFPSSPSTGQISSQNGRTYVWTGAAWELASNVAGHAAQHSTGGSDAITPSSIGAVAASDSRLTDTRTPTDGSVTTAKIADLAVTDAKVAGVAASKLTGTLDDARLSSNVTLQSQLNTLLGQAAGVTDAMPRVTAVGGVTAGAGQVIMALFTPITTVTVSQISMGNTGTVSSGLTLARMGIYTYPTDGGTATLVARTASDTTLFTVANTVYTRSLDTAGGYPATFTLQSGTRYGVAVICVGTTQPQLVGRSVGAAIGASMSPRISSASAINQTDLPVSFTPSINSQAPFARLS